MNLDQRYVQVGSQVAGIGFNDKLLNINAQPAACSPVRRTPGEEASPLGRAEQVRGWRGVTDPLQGRERDLKADPIRGRCERWRSSAAAVTRSRSESSLTHPFPTAQRQEGAPEDSARHSSFAGESVLSRADRRGALFGSLLPVAGFAGTMHYRNDVNDSFPYCVENRIRKYMDEHPADLAIKTAKSLRSTACS